MSILVHKDTNVLVQGITGKEGQFHTKMMLDYGTKVVAGVTPGKGGEKVFNVPVYNSVREAQKLHRIDAAVIFVPAYVAGDALMEALDRDIGIIACITEGIPVRQMLNTKKMVEEKKAVMIGPNCPGIITPGETKLGILPGNIFKKGNVGVISRSGTLTYLVVDELTKAGVGQSTCVGIGGDPILGTTFRKILELFMKDTETKAVVLIGEIGGSQEEEAAEFIKDSGLPVVAYIAGKTAPPGKKMGHAGAIISGDKGTAKAKIKAFNDSGIPVANTALEVVEIIKEIL